VTFEPWINGESCDDEENTATQMYSLYSLRTALLWSSSSNYWDVAYILTFTAFTVLKATADFLLRFNKTK
jgi:hypothetical protein